LTVLFPPLFDALFLIIYAGDPVAVPRVLEVIKGQLCYIIGTVYMDMPLKPNVLEDIARDVRLIALNVILFSDEQQQALPVLPPSAKYYSEDDNIMLEDESGRIKLVGERLKDARIVTGVIMGALGMETPNGEFEVLDYCFAEMPSQPAEDDVQTDEMEIDGDGELQ